MQPDIEFSAVVVAQNSDFGLKITSAAIFPPNTYPSMRQRSRS
jgi:hypothetical protein